MVFNLIKTQQSTLYKYLGFLNTFEHKIFYAMSPHSNRNLEMYYSFFWAYARTIDYGSYILYEAIFGDRQRKENTFLYVYRFG